MVQWRAGAGSLLFLLGQIISLFLKMKDLLINFLLDVMRWMPEDLILLTFDWYNPLARYLKEPVQ